MTSFSRVREKIRSFFQGERDVAGHIGKVSAYLALFTVDAMSGGTLTLAVIVGTSAVALEGILGLLSKLDEVPKDEDWVQERFHLIGHYSYAKALNECLTDVRRSRGVIQIAKDALDRIGLPDVENIETKWLHSTRIRQACDQLFRNLGIYVRYVLSSLDIEEDKIGKMLAEIEERAYGIVKTQLIDEKNGPIFRLSLLNEIEHQEKSLELFDEHIENLHEHQVATASDNREIGDLLLEKMGSLEGLIQRSVAGERIDEYDKNIDKACEFMAKDQSEPLVCRRMLETLQADTDSWQKITPQHRFRVLANLGHTYRMTAEIDRAVTYYAEACSHVNDTLDSKAIDALRFFLLESTKEAFDITEKLRQEGTSNNVAASIWVRSAPDWETIEDDFPSFSDELRDDKNVLLALADRAFQEEKFEEAEKYAGKVVNASPKWSRPYYRLATGILSQELVSYENALQSQRPIGNQDRIREAIGYLNKTLDLEQHNMPTQLKSGIFLERAFAHYCLRDDRNARNDLELAKEYAAVVAEHAIRYMQLCAIISKTENAIDVLRPWKFDRSAPVARLFLAIALSATRAADDLSEATDILITCTSDYKDADPDLRFQILDTLIQILLDREMRDEARAVVENLRGTELPASYHRLLESRFYHRLGNENEALKSALSAAEHCGEGASREEQSRIANLLTVLKRYDEALKIWKEINASARPGACLYQLLECARQSNEHKIILDACETVRGSGIWDRTCLEYELAILELYRPDRAVELMQEYLKFNDDALVRLRLSLSGVRLQRSDLIEPDPAKLPQLDDVSPIMALAVVTVLMHGGNADRALKYSYALMRKYPDAPEVHMTFVFVLSPFEGEAVKIPESTTVVPGVAVNIEIPSLNDTRWVIIEEDHEPTPPLEFAPSHPMSKALDGKKVGDEFTLPGQGGVQRTATIRSIVSKYIYYYRDILSNWEIRFPETDFVHRFNVPQDIQDKEGQVSLGEIDAVLQGREQSINELDNIFEGGQLPISMLSTELRAPVIDTVCHVIQSPRLRIRCATGSNEERQEAGSLLASGPVLKLDLCAVATLWILDAHKLVLHSPLNCSVTPSTVQAVKDMLAIEIGTARESGRLGYLKGVPFFERTSEESKEKRIESLRELAHSLEEVCDSAAGEALLEFDPDRRQNWISMLGRSTIETVTAAKHSGHLLWTDDLVLRRLCRGEFKLKSVWTHSVLTQMLREELIEDDAFAELTVRLIALKYSIIGINAPLVLKAAEMSEYDADKWPLSEVLGSFGLAEFDARQLALIALQVIKSIWQSGRIADTHSAVTFRILSNLAEHPGGMRVIKQMDAALEQIFGLDYFSYRQVEALFQRFIASKERPGGLILL